MSTENSILKFSLKPIFICMAICGVPVSNKKTFLKIIILAVVFFSLFVNVCCTNNQFIKEWNDIIKTHLEIMVIELPKDILWIPTAIFRLLELATRRIFHFGIPLIFSAQFFFTNRWHEILKSITKIEGEMVFTRRFYRRCRNRCIFAMFMSILVITIFYKF